AVVGAGPAGMAAAQQLRRMGHTVTLLERDESAGGLMRFGVPDFKIEKTVVERRMQQLIAEGVELRVGIDVGVDVTVEELRDEFDAVILATGSRVPRDLPVPGRELDGVHYAMEFLYERNRRVSRVDGPEPQGIIPPDGGITAKGKKVVVIGGGDTGADCVANSLREGAVSVVQLELLPEPPANRPDDRTPWPLWPAKYRKSYAKEELDALEKGEQDFSVITTSFEGENGVVKKLNVSRAADAPPFAPVDGTEFEIEADLVLLAMGFLHPEQDLLDQLGVEKDPRGNVKSVKPYTSSVDGVFAAGDCRRGQSLIVWAINEGRRAAKMADKYLGERAKDVADALSVGPSVGGGGPWWPANPLPQTNPLAWRLANSYFRLPGRRATTARRRRGGRRCRAWRFVLPAVSGGEERLGLRGVRSALVLGRSGRMLVQGGLGARGSGRRLGLVLGGSLFRPLWRGGAPLYE
ncbi:MAG: glutamate synthase subunit beta, partial [Patulibacter sp.]|nr:glutamate synthase subunit beta [Patulibacter sp.]